MTDEVPVPSQHRYFDRNRPEPIPRPGMTEISVPVEREGRPSVAFVPPAHRYFGQRPLDPPLRKGMVEVSRSMAVCASAAHRLRWPFCGPAQVATSFGPIATVNCAGAQIADQSKLFGADFGPCFVVTCAGVQNGVVGWDTAPRNGSTLT